MQENCTKLECSERSIDELTRIKKAKLDVGRWNVRSRIIGSKSVRGLIEERVFRSSQSRDDFSAYASSYWKQSGAEIKAE